VRVPTHDFFCYTLIHFVPLQNQLQNGKVKYAVLGAE
jgi:hypothetical protein